ncbi:MAG: hypothetical protein EOM52_10080 [Clostridia bacterium]|nr:hypothetical protein [Clostridia bacterium]
MPTPRGTCPYGRKPLFPITGSMPEPLYGPLRGRGERRTEKPPAAPVPESAAAPAPESTHIPVRAAEPKPEMRICRYTNTIPAPPDPALTEALCLLRKQNELLTEILAALAED